MGLVIYGDRKIEREFLGKRERLEARLRAEGVDTSGSDFMDPEYFFIALLGIKSFLI